MMLQKIRQRRKTRKQKKTMEKGFGNKNRKPPKCARNDEKNI